MFTALGVALDTEDPKRLDLPSPASQTNMTDGRCSFHIVTPILTFIVVYELVEQAIAFHCPAAFIPDKKGKTRIA